ncbi:MAG: T6SS phospholipase effector Tle1-like catalytic domain-containing protein [Fimbriimonas sp.]
MTDDARNEIVSAYDDLIALGLARDPQFHQAVRAMIAQGDPFAKPASSDLTQRLLTGALAELEAAIAAEERPRLDAVLLERLREIMARPSKAPKNIVVCIDGTSDFAAGQPTHVFRLYKALERSPDQVAYYDGGVGTLADVTQLTLLRQKVLKTLDQAAATSIYRNFLEAYRFLVRHYQPGDRIFLFGFSRGAYAIRALAGAIHYFGIPRPDQENLLPFLWQEYRSIGDKSKLEAGRWPRLRLLQSAFGRPAKIEYLGAWDTVSTVGLIALRTLPQTSKLESVRYVRHAVSIDERRNMFPENLIDRRVPGHYECWFAGVHRDVGGGGSPQALGLSMIPFDWVLQGATQRGLRLDPAALTAMRDPTGDPLGKDNDNVWITRAFGVLGIVPMRWWHPGKDRYAWRWLNFRNVRRLPAEAWVHRAVAARQAHAPLRYAPENLKAGEVRIMPTFDIAHPANQGTGWNDEVATLLHTQLQGATKADVLHRAFFSPAAVAEWRRLFARWHPSIQYSALYTPQTPDVSFESETGKPRQARLGDLLVILSDRVTSQRVAWLLQLRTSPTWPPTNEAWALYRTWPRVTYTVAPGAEAVSRTMPFAGACDPAAQYLLLDPAQATAETRVCSTNPMPESLAESFAALFHGFHGRPFSRNRNEARNDWDHLVWDLIEAIRGPSASRGLDLLQTHGHGLTMAAAKTLGQGWGIPVIHLEV